MLVCCFFLALIGTAFGQWDPNYVEGRAGMVHLFEWNWDVIAEECETYLASNKYGGVQISPPNENAIITKPPDTWWERYQSVSYKLVTRGGNRTQFANMVDRCNAVGVRIYPDAIINHMCAASLGEGYGTAGSYYDTRIERYDGVPYSNWDFNDNRCSSSSGGIENNGNIDQIRNCQLVSLQDLNMGKEYVRGKIIDYLNDLISLGVAGFRIDASNHMWPGDLKAIFSSLNNLPVEKGFPAGTRPYIMQEVIARPWEPVNPLEYYPLGQLTEFNYALDINKNRDKIHHLRTFGEDWALYPSKVALIFLNNHDNQRRDDQYIDFDQSYDLKIFTAFMLAWPYGLPRIMSSYHYHHHDDGPPEKQRSVNPDGSCGNGWVCEHRWRQIKNMIHFSVLAKGEPVMNWWTNNDNQIAFSRGTKTFIAINKSKRTMDIKLTTGLPRGTYCDVISGNYEKGTCTGKCIYVDENSEANINIVHNSDPFIAIHIEAPCSANQTAECKECDTCGIRVHCGNIGTSQSDCERKGCLWCPLKDKTNPWCIARITTVESRPLMTCAVQDAKKRDCGFIGIDDSRCLIKGCCWNPAVGDKIPWCYHPA